MQEFSSPGKKVIDSRVVYYGYWKSEVGSWMLEVRCWKQERNAGLQTRQIDVGSYILDVRYRKTGIF